MEDDQVGAVAQRHAALEQEFSAWMEKAKPGTVIPERFAAFTVSGGGQRGGRPRKYARVFLTWPDVRPGACVTLYIAKTNSAVNTAKSYARMWLRSLQLAHHWRLRNTPLGGGRWALITERTNEYGPPRPQPH